MINNPIIFYIAAFILVMFTVFSMLAKNIVYSLLCSIMVFFSAGLFFYILGSEYNAIVQVSVYGFAVPIIIGLAIMFMSEEKEKQEKYKLRYITILSSAMFILSFVYVVMISLSMQPNTFSIISVQSTNFYDVILSFAKGIFVNYVFAFELLSLILTIIIAGFTLFRKRGA